jgi:hypothetical protein
LPFKSKSRLEAENAALRHQLIVLRRKVRGRARLSDNDRWFFVQLYRWFPSILEVLTIIRPETLVRWHRAGFRRYWRWKSRSRGGRPQIETELRGLIRQMSMENLLWGGPRIHGELLKLGFEVAQSTVAKYMVKRRGPPKLLELKADFWDAAIAACPRASFQPACSLVLTALSNVFEVAQLRAGAAEKHPPQIIYLCCSASVWAVHYLRASAWRQRLSAA